MVTRQDATLNLSSLLSHAPGAETEVSEEGLLEPSEALLEADGMQLMQPLSWRLTVRNTGGDDDFILTGEVGGVARMECRRCLTEVPTEITTEFVYPMAYRPGVEELTLEETGEDDADVLLFGKPDVDFAPLLAQVFAIDLPLTVLCKEDCRGLAIDGVNLNDHPDHQAPARERDAVDDSPFAVLKDLDL